MKLSAETILSPSSGHRRLPVARRRRNVQGLPATRYYQCHAYIALLLLLSLTQHMLLFIIRCRLHPLFTHYAAAFAAALRCAGD